MARGVMYMHLRRPRMEGTQCGQNSLQDNTGFVVVVVMEGIALFWR